MRKITIFLALIQLFIGCVQSPSEQEKYSSVNIQTSVRC